MLNIPVERDRIILLYLYNKHSLLIIDLALLWAHKLNSI
ncbi:hypothetical protein NT6N_06740 [Oceaniferula spumae]|uniref:Uncharacterized protein n=1 Tax=Oceaniferula spumae TaxID=2979115 RepID=A0AAT9FI22_9BACT